MMQETLSVSQVAHKKIIYHCLRYVSSKVYGALIKQKGSSIISNAYPLFHTPISAPTLSLALDLIESNLQQNEQIVGFYEFCEENSSVVMPRICENNQQLRNMFVVKVFSRQKSFDFKSDEVTLTVPKFDINSQDLIQGKYRLIVDLDAHLDTIELDFRNLYVK